MEDVVYRSNIQKANQYKAHFILSMLAACFTKKIKWYLLLKILEFWISWKAKIKFYFDNDDERFLTLPSL